MFYLCCDVLGPPAGTGIVFFIKININAKALVFLLPGQFGAHI